MSNLPVKYQPQELVPVDRRTMREITRAQQDVAYIVARARFGQQAIGGIYESGVATTSRTVVAMNKHIAEGIEGGMTQRQAEAIQEESYRLIDFQKAVAERASVFLIRTLFPD